MTALDRSPPPPREHPLWPRFKAWAEAAVPTLMWETHWLAFLEGVTASSRPPARPDAASRGYGQLVQHGTMDCRPATAPTEEV